MYGDEQSSINKLINLDVSHYKIATNGALSVGNGYTQTEQCSDFLQVYTVLNSFNKLNTYNHSGTFIGTDLTNGKYEAKITPSSSGTCYYDPKNNRVILIGKKGEYNNKISFKIRTPMDTSIGPHISMQNVNITASVNTKVLSLNSYFVDGDRNKKIALD